MNPLTTSSIHGDKHFESHMSGSDWTYNELGNEKFYLKHIGSF